MPCVKELLSTTVDYSHERILSHSFRASVPTILAKRGFGREAIANTGRWSSEEYNRYCKSGRGNQLSTQRDIANCLAQEADKEPREILVYEDPMEDAV